MQQFSTGSAEPEVHETKSDTGTENRKGAAKSSDATGEEPAPDKARAADEVATLNLPIPTQIVATPVPTAEANLPEAQTGPVVATATAMTGMTPEAALSDVADGTVPSTAIGMSHADRAKTKASTAHKAGKEAAQANADGVPDLIVPAGRTVTSEVRDAIMAGPAAQTTTHAADSVLKPVAHKKAASDAVDSSATKGPRTERTIPQPGDKRRKVEPRFEHSTDPGTDHPPFQEHHVDPGSVPRTAGADSTHLLEHSPQAVATALASPITHEQPHAQQNAGSTLPTIEMVDPPKMVDTAQLKQTSDGTQLKVAVDVPELGRIEVRAISTHEGTTAHITTDRREALQVLSLEQPDLVHSLQAKQVILGGMDFSGSSGGMYQQRDPHSSSPAPVRELIHANSTPPQDPITLVADQFYSEHAAGLNLRA